ncbi:hypothetical protein BDY24DRAFT_400112 [Mrakia frigida]|uniref:uncharacterized protein n=1 Tax=Mrakia frigida TaxID=29902 RepID=UPI003FCC0F90
MSTAAHVDLGAPIGDGRIHDVASQFDSTKPLVETNPPTPNKVIQSQAQALPPSPSPPPPPPPPPPVPVKETSPPAPIVTSRPPTPPPKVDVPPSPVRPQKEWETRLTPSSQSPAPNDDGSSLRPTPIVVADQKVVPPIHEKDHVVELEKKAAEKREIKGQAPLGTVVLGIEDDRLWAGLRRFDKQITHVLSPPHQLPHGEPDLRRSPLPTVPFNSDLIRSNLERLYATAGVSGIRFSREMSRLMVWSPEERHRTGAFCAAYFFAWIFHQTTPLILALIIVLIMVPRSRPILFPTIPPPAGVPPSATDPTNSKGDESLVAATHPQKHRSKSEQIEEQSWEFMKSVEGFGLRVLVGGRHKPSEKQLHMAREKDRKKFGDDTSSDEEEVDKTRLVVPGGAGVVGGRDEVGTGRRDETLKDGGTVAEANEDEAAEAKAKRDAVVGLYAKGLQDALGDFADFVERLANTLTPPAHYPRNQARAKLAFALFLPILIVTAVVPARIFAHAGSFAFGVGFFAQPLLIRAAKAFVRAVPDWQEQLDLRNSIFSHVPTEAQLTLHLLRERERADNPLPRPPTSATSVEAQKKLNDTSPMSNAHEQDTTSSVGDGDESHLVGDGDHDEEGKGPSKLKSTMVGLGKKLAAKGATFRGAGKVEVLPEGVKKPKRSTKTKLSAFILNRQELKDDGSIWAYPARLSGKTGHIVIDKDDDDPITEADVLFVPKDSDEPSKSFKIGEIAELKKGGVGLPRSVLGWAAGMELGGTSLEVRIKRSTTYRQGYETRPNVFVTNVYFEEEGEEEEGGEVIQFERIGRRDQLFLRLLAGSPSQWETL